jgi:hypothetical protein
MAVSAPDWRGLGMFLFSGFLSGFVSLLAAHSFFKMLVQIPAVKQIFREPVFTGQSEK